METLLQALKSKTIWLGIATICTGIGMYVSGEQNLQELLFGANGILIIVFRLITNESIHAK